MAVSVIISNMNGAKFLPRLLETLKAQRGVKLEIIVVDRRSKDESAAILAQHPDVKVVSHPPETGLVSGYHCGYLASTCEHLFMMNEDMWLDPDCLRLLEERIDLGKRIAAADPWQWSYDEKRWIHGGTRFRKVKWAINGGHPSFDNEFTVDIPAGSRVPYPCAGALLIHRKAYEEIGFWDTSFFLDNEDTDFFLRAWQKNWHTVLVPEAKVYHAVGMSNTGAKLASGQTRAGKRRYISNRIGKTVVAWKYFSLPKAIVLGTAIWFVTFANNLVKLRFRTVGWDLKVLAECLRRLPAIRAFRKANAAANREHPGEKFFAEPEFRLQTK
jgi:GT2 family glycosyltransferase